MFITITIFLSASITAKTPEHSEVSRLDPIHLEIRDLTKVDDTSQHVTLLVPVCGSQNNRNGDILLGQRPRAE